MSSEVPAAERDLWLLVATAESEVPLAVAKVGRLSGISLHPVAPYRSERDAITLGPRLTVTGAATMSNSQRQDFTYFGVEASPCGSLDDALARYPALVPKYMPTGHSEAEEQVCALPRDWGSDLMFGVNPKTRCLQDFSLQG